MTARILVLGEKHSRADHAAATLIDHGYEVRVVPADAVGAAQVGAFWPDLVLLHFEGCVRTELLAEVRQRSGVPLMVWAGTWNTQDAVRMLRQGADDYIGGQVAVEEVEARVVANLRRAEWGMREKEL